MVIKIVLFIHLICFYIIMVGDVLLFVKKRKRARGIEPPYPAWEAGVLPMNYARGWNKSDVHCSTFGGKRPEFFEMRPFLKNLQ